MGVQDPGGGIPLNNYFSSLEELGEPRRKIGKKVLYATKSVTEEEKFLVMESVTEGKDLSKVNPFLLQKVIENTMCGKPEQVVRMKDGKLLIKVKNEKIANKLEKLKKIPDGKGEILVKVAEHPTLNSSKGVIRCPDIEHMTEEEILAGLKDQRVTFVAIMKRKIGDTLVNTKAAVVTFSTTKIPRSVDFGLYPVLVDQYIPKPMRCTTCMKIGHTKKWCKGERVCANCSLPAHGGECSSTRCVSCGDAHNTLNRECPVYVDEVEIQKIKTIQRVTYAEARAIRRKQCPAIPKKMTTERSYAQTASNQTETKTTTNEKQNSTNEKTNTNIEIQQTTDSQSATCSKTITTLNVNDTDNRSDEIHQTTVELNSATTKTTINDEDANQLPSTSTNKLVLRTDDGSVIRLRSLSASEKSQLFRKQ